MVMRSLLLKRRSQESAADQAGLRLLTTTRQSGRGMLETFERFAEQESLAAKATRSCAAIRVAARSPQPAARLVETSPYANAQDPPELQLRHDMMRAKLDGHVARTADRYQPLPRKQQQPARALRARHRPQLLRPSCSASDAGEIDALIREKPDNPYFWELKGELYC